MTANLFLSSTRTVPDAAQGNDIGDCFIIIAAGYVAVDRQWKHAARRLRERIPVGPVLLSQIRQMAQACTAPAVGLNPRFPAAREKYGKKSFCAGHAAKNSAESYVWERLGGHKRRLAGKRQGNAIFAITEN
jgi:hypothetical protein